MNLGEMIKARRVELGLTPREMARRAGLHYTAFRTIELTGSVESLSLRQIRSLERAAGIDVLAAVHPMANATSDGGPDDAATLGALLMRPGAAGALESATIARAFGWTQNRFETARSALDQQLRNTGARIVESEDSSIEIVAAQDQDVANAERQIAASPEAMQLDDDDLEIVLDVAECHGQRIVRLYEEYSQADRRRIARLVESGLLEANDEIVELSDSAAISLFPILGDRRASKSWTLSEDLRTSRRSVAS